MKYLIGTSGYNYPEWRGTFYPEKLPAAKMLAFYAERFTTVEINYTFYRIPTPKLLEGWANGSPDGFIFTLKAPRKITHDARLRNCEDLTTSFCRTATTLGEKLGVLLFQLPPFLRRDDAVLDAFLDALPEGTRAAFEFRHVSLLDETVFAALRRRNVALCIADSEKMKTPVVATADYAYFRLRDEGYQPADIGSWASVIRGQRHAGSTYVYFKHEEEGKGPEFAQMLLAALAA
ncbi:MAG: DUF72 domain-containing protein [Vicinamibacterales bacterium]